MSTHNYTAFDVDVNDARVMTVTLDCPGRPMNVLDATVLSELEQIVHELENRKDVEVVVFRSGKESGFLAGADVSALASLKSTTLANRLIEEGQLLFQRIEWLSAKTIVVIDGPCLGGGLELALACDHRIARNNSATKIGLPEIKLGLIPAWGGTQRLPKTVGLTAALPMILTGRHVGAAEAEQMGLISAAICPTKWEEGVSEFVESVRQGQSTPSRRRAWFSRFLDGTRWGRAITLAAAERKIASKTRAYPALAAALKAIRAGFDAPPTGFACERMAFVDLLATPTCRNLLGLFFSRERARKLVTWSSRIDRAVHQHPIRRVGIVGAGAMGAGIAQLAASRGYEVTLKEISPEAAQAGRHRIEKLIDSAARHKRMSVSARNEWLDKITISCDASSLCDCDLVIEAVVENAETKASVFRMLDNVVATGGILATNTSALSVGSMADVTERERRVAGLHFFNPVHRMELVEVVRAVSTNDETVALLVGFVRSLGKTPVVTSDCPGFLVNRALFPYLGEAIRLLREGHGAKKIDGEARRFGMPMGPLQLLDQVGLDVALHVATTLSTKLFGVDQVIGPLQAMVDAGRLGKKSGGGFYRHQRSKQRNTLELPFAIVPPRTVGEEIPFGQDGLTVLQRRLIYPMICESIRCLEEGVVQEAWAIDLGMVLGTGFAPHLGGPLHVADAIGPRTFRDNLVRLRSCHGDRFTTPESLMASADTGARYLPIEPMTETGPPATPLAGQ